MVDIITEENFQTLFSGIERYNPEKIPLLEDYVGRQASEETYNLDANLAILKLYQFNPQEFKESVTCQILLKALMNLPHTDFILCKCLIIEQHQSVESVNKVIELSNLLETCEFQQFWQELKECSELIKDIKGFRQCIQKFIASVVHLTYEVIKKSMVMHLLEATAEEFSTICTENGWREEGDNLRITDQEAHIQSKNISEKITFQDVSSIIRSAMK